MPIPPETGSAVLTEIGDTVFTTLILTDPDSNVQSGAEEVIDFELGTEAGEFFVEIEGDGFSETYDGTNAVTDDFQGSTSLADILPDIGSLSLAETGSSTGVFDEELEFVNGGLDTDDWHDLEITITFVDGDGDEESAGITFRGTTVASQLTRTLPRQEQQQQSL
jgi:hypothetical protein